jgi:uncharacterized membrane protein YjjP (DUF1212 family)
MDYNTLLELVAELGHRLAMCGAETFRVEESVNRILGTYGIESEVFSIPNCLIVSIETPEGKPMTRMRRIGYHGNDLDSVEKYSNLSRRICAEKPDPKTAKLWLQQTDHSRRSYSPIMSLVGSALGAGGFSILFGASMMDALCAGICGILVGLVDLAMNELKANQFFRTIAASFFMAMLAYTFMGLGLSDNCDAVIIGTLMLLVPGLLFTNAMRDIIYGDTNSGINRIVQVFLIAAAICLGTGTAWTLSVQLWGEVIHGTTVTHSLLIQSIFCFIGCSGFFILFNIHGPGGLICSLGGVVTWIIYSVIIELGYSDILGYFWATVFASLYAEVMARIRKYPAISYLIVSIFPLIPGAGVYYTMNHAVHGDMTAFADRGMHTVAIAGVMAVGILLSSTLFRIWSNYQNAKAKTSG